MRARITSIYIIGHFQVEWLNEDGSVYELSVPLPTLSAALAWCREQDIGYWQPFGFSEDFIAVGAAE